MPIEIGRGTAPVQVPLGPDHDRQPKPLPQKTNDTVPTVGAVQQAPVQVPTQVPTPTPICPVHGPEHLRIECNVPLGQYVETVCLIVALTQAANAGDGYADAILNGFHFLAAKATLSEDDAEDVCEALKNTFLELGGDEDGDDDEQQ